MPLSPSERVHLIRDIASRFDNDDWQAIDMILNQFGIPTPNGWNDSKSRYVMSTIQQAPDQTLLDLAHHTGSQSLPSLNPAAQPSFWRQGMFKVFLTHLARERQFAADLQVELLNFGISCFVAHNDIEPTSEWQSEIEAALSSCDALVALLHDDFHQSNWTDQEIGFAMGRGVPVFSVRLGQDPYGFIGRFQAFKNKPVDALAVDLFDAYRKNRQTRGRLGEVLVRLFEESNSYAEAKRRIGYLEELAIWEPAFAERIREAARVNSQISGSWGVSGRVNMLASKWEAP